MPLDRYGFPIHPPQLCEIEGVPTRFYRPPAAVYQPAAPDPTYMVPRPTRPYAAPPSAVSVAAGRIMWAIDDLRRAAGNRLHGWRTEEPRLRRIDGVFIWFASAVATALSVLGGLELFG